MNIQQLRIIAEASRQSFNFTAVARALYISQPAISKSIKEFEDELGVELFKRKGKRILGFTEVGNRLLELAEDILGNVRKIKSLKNEFLDKGQYDLNINAGDLNSGVYYYQLKTKSFIDTKKMTILK